MLSGALNRPVPRRKLPPPCQPVVGLKPQPPSSLLAAGATVCVTALPPAAATSAAVAPAARQEHAYAGSVVGSATQVAGDVEEALVAEVNKAAAAVEEAPSPSSPSSGGCSSRRLYELVIHNYTDRHFKLVGPTQPIHRKVPLGRLLHLQPNLVPADAAAISRAFAGRGALPAFIASAIPPPPPDPEVRPAAQAVFGDSAHSAKEDALEFTLSFMDAASEEGFTVRVNAHARSPLRSDAIASGQGLDVSSVLQTLPRLVSQPPLGYADTTLGVYRKPERDEAARLGTLIVGTEVLAGGEVLQGRWMHISAPFEGWIQARTRDGRPLLQDAEGQPNMRQVVAIRPRNPADIQCAVAAASVRFSGEDCAGLWPPAPWAEKETQSWVAEMSHFKNSAALGEANRLDKEASNLEAKSFLGLRSRKALVGALPCQEMATSRHL